MFKAVDRNDTIRIAVSNDPAIDDSSDFDAYAEAYDKKHLVLIGDEEPTWFTLGTISYLKFSEIKDRHISFGMGDNGQEIKTHLFGLITDTLRLSLRKIENAPFELKFEHCRVSDKTMTKLSHIGVVEELGNLALDLNGFSGEDEKK